MFLEIMYGNPVVYYGWRRRPFRLYNISEDVFRWVKNDFATNQTNIKGTAADFVWRHFGRKRFSKAKSQYSDWAYIRFARYAAWLLSWPESMMYTSKGWYAKPEYYWHLRTLYSFDVVDWRYREDY